MTDERQRFPGLVAIQAVNEFIAKGDFDGLDHFVKSVPYNPRAETAIIGTLRASYRVRDKLPSWQGRLEHAWREFGDRAEHRLRGLNQNSPNPDSYGYPYRGDGAAYEAISYD